MNRKKRETDHQIENRATNREERRERRPKYGGSHVTNRVTRLVAVSIVQVSLSVQLHSLSIKNYTGSNVMYRATI